MERAATSELLDSLQFFAQRVLHLLGAPFPARNPADIGPVHPQLAGDSGDRKSTRLNSSHVSISYAVFCLKKESMTMVFQIVRRLSRRDGRRFAGALLVAIHTQEGWAVARASGLKGWRRECIALPALWTYS